MPARTFEPGILRGTFVNYQDADRIKSKTDLKVTSKQQSFRLLPNENY
jgi:hypothetical protein